MEIGKKKLSNFTYTQCLSTLPQTLLTWSGLPHLWRGLWLDLYINGPYIPFCGFRCGREMTLAGEEAAGAKGRGKEH